MQSGSYPHADGQLMLTDSGLETDLVFNKGVELPEFASFPLLDDETGRGLLEQYYRDHAAVAAEHGTGFVFETPTWRSNADWGPKLGYSQDQLDRIDREAVALVVGVRDSGPQLSGPTSISGLLGPRGDGYAVGTAMSVETARGYHAHQVGVLAEAGCDLVSTLTMNYAAEATGIALAARAVGVPVAVSFTVETDGRLPDGSTLEDAIAAVDRATGRYVAYFGVNCAHPDHIWPGLDPSGDWVQRVGWIRANASRLSHAELDEAEVLDEGDPAGLGADYRMLAEAFPNITVWGGCCGTDIRHVRAIAAQLAPMPPGAARA